MRRQYMTTIAGTEKRMELRRESRKEVGYPRFYASIRSLEDGSEINGGLLVDISGSGVGLITSHPYPVGTEISINIDNRFGAIGEVIDVEEAWEEWDWAGMVRLSVRLILKESWPF